MKIDRTVVPVQEAFSVHGVRRDLVSAPVEDDPAHRHPFHERATGEEALVATAWAKEHHDAWRRQQRRLLILHGRDVGVEHSNRRR